MGIPLVPPGKAENSHWTQKGQIYFGGSEFSGLPQSLDFDHLANSPSPNPCWEPRLGEPLLRLPSSMTLTGLKINERKDHCAPGASALPFSLFLGKCSIFVGAGWGMHSQIHTHICIYLSPMRSGHLKDSFLLAEFFQENSPGQCFCPACLLHHVSRAMQSQDRRTALVQQLMDETSSSRPHRLDSQFTSAQRLTTASHPVASENLLISDWFAACILAASKLSFFSRAYPFCSASCPDWARRL